jgi:hypothetical protein
MSTADDALSEAGKTVEDYAALDRAIGAVLFNASNFPERVQSRLLGQNMRPLNEKLADAVLAAGFRRPSPPTDEQIDAATRAFYDADPILDLDEISGTPVPRPWASTGDRYQDHLRGLVRAALEAADLVGGAA